MSILNQKVRWHTSITLSLVVAVVWFLLFFPVWRKLPNIRYAFGIGGWGDFALLVVGTIIALSTFGGLLAAGISDILSTLMARGKANK